jgi:hypothetical protein
LNGSGFTRILAGIIALAALLPAQAWAAELTAEAARAFERYALLAEERMQAELRNPSAFIWVDALPSERRGRMEERLNRGEVITERVETAGAESKPARGTMIHHWRGVAFIPGASLKRVLSLVQDYDRHHVYYQPQVVKSKLLARSADDFTLYMRLKQIKILTAVFDTEHQVHYTQMDARRAYSSSRSTKALEVRDAGEPVEHTLPQGNDRGFLWRINSYWRFMESPRGVYVQCEAITLTRDIPLGLSWLVGRYIQGIAQDSLEFTAGHP